MNDNTNPPEAPGAEAPVPKGREADRKLSNETRLALTVARISKAIGEGTPINIVLGALATIAGQVIFATAPGDPGRRRHNIAQFIHGLESSLRMMESTAAEHERRVQEAKKMQEDAQRSDVIRIAKKPKLKVVE
jgi:hypothetical protein